MELEFAWNAWYDHAAPGRSAKDYEKSLHQVCTVKTVQEFWGCFNNMPALQSLSLKCGYHFMKNEVKPVWEDPTNRKGGVWNLQARREDAPLVWKEILMAIIGDIYKDSVKSCEVNGVSISKKKADYLITIWVSSPDGKAAIMDYLCNLFPKVKVEQQFHDCLSLMRYLKS